MTKPLNVGMIGYGFMGRAHSHAYRKVWNFFDLAYRPVLKAACARDADKVKAFADQWGYESIETDWRKLLERKDIDCILAAVPDHWRRPGRASHGLLGWGQRNWRKLASVRQPGRIATSKTSRGQCTRCGRQCRAIPRR